MLTTLPPGLQHRIEADDAVRAVRQQQPDLGALADAQLLEAGGGPLDHVPDFAIAQPLAAEIGAVGLRIGCHGGVPAGSAPALPRWAHPRPGPSGRRPPTGRGGSSDGRSRLRPRCARRTSAAVARRAGRETGGREGHRRSAWHLPWEHTPGTVASSRRDSGHRRIRFICDWRLVSKTGGRPEFSLGRVVPPCGGEVSYR